MQRIVHRAPRTLISCAGFSIGSNKWCANASRFWSGENPLSIACPARATFSSGTYYSKKRSQRSLGGIPDNGLREVSVSEADKIVSAYLKRFMLRIHPDLFQGLSHEYAECNTQSLATLNAMLAFARAEVNDSHDLRVGKPTVPPKQSVSFYVFALRNEPKRKKTDLRGTLAAAAFVDDDGTDEPFQSPPLVKTVLDLSVPKGMGLNMLSYVHVKLMKLLQEAGVEINEQDQEYLRQASGRVQHALDGADQDRQQPQLIRRMRDSEVRQYQLDMARKMKVFDPPSTRFGGDIERLKLDAIQALLPLMVRHQHVTFDESLSPLHRWKALNRLQQAIVDHFVALSCAAWPSNRVRLHICSQWSDISALIRPSKIAEADARNRAALASAAESQSQSGWQQQLESLTGHARMSSMGAKGSSPVLNVPWNFDATSLVTYVRMYLDVLVDGKPQQVAIVQPPVAGSQNEKEQVFQAPTAAQLAAAHRKAAQGKLSHTLIADALSKADALVKDGTAP